jgi:hypothetical protein
LFRHAAGVGRFYPRRISDLLRIGAHLEVTCRGCGRRGIYDTRAVMQWFTTSRPRRNDDWTIAGSYFRCEACRHRGAELGWVPSPREARPAPLESANQRRQRLRRERG